MNWRARARDAVNRRQRGLVVEEAEVDALLTKMVDMLTELDGPMLKGKNGFESMMGELEDAAYNARSAADDIENAIESIRKAVQNVTRAA